MAQPLPLELWYMIAGFLPRLQRNSLLGISRLHRDIARKLLFSNIILFMRAPEPYELELPPSTVKDLHHSTMIRTWEILNAIRSDPSFSGAVKRLEIYPFVEPHEPFGVFQIMPICDALKALPHLESLVWNGIRHPIPVPILESLSAHCPGLKVLSFPINNFPSTSRQLKHIRSLTFRYICVDGAPEDEVRSTIAQELEDFVDISDIRSLNVSSLLLWKLPIRMFDNLSSLDITGGTDLENLHLIFHHTPRLQSVAFIGLHDNQLFQVLAENPTVLPLLTSFKIMECYSANKNEEVHERRPEDLTALSNFLRNKVHLRRLDVHLNCAEIGPLYDVLLNLPSLQVLGIFTGLDVLVREHYLQLEKVISPNLTALRLATRWEIVPETRDVAEAIVQRFNDLSFLYIRNVYLPFVFIMDELACELDNVLILGLDQRMAYVDRVTINEQDREEPPFEVDIIPWSWRRTQFRSVDDFAGCEDYEWLLRHHTLKEWEW